MKNWNKIIAVLCCAEAVVKGFLAYTEHSAVYAVLAGLWLILAVIYVRLTRDEE